MTQPAAVTTRATDFRARVLRALRAVGFALAGVIHLLPLPGLLGRETLQRVYGIGIDDAGLELLLRHRALLFGLLGLLLLGAIRVPAWRVPALVAGTLSALAFVLLVDDYARLGAALQRVVIGDLVAVVALALATIAHVLLWRRAGAGGGAMR